MNTRDIKILGRERDAERIGGGNPLFFYSSTKRNEKLNPWGLHLFFVFYLHVFESFCSLTLSLLHLISAFLHVLLQIFSSEWFYRLSMFVSVLPDLCVLPLSQSPSLHPSLSLHGQEPSLCFLSDVHIISSFSLFLCFCVHLLHDQLDIWSNLQTFVLKWFTFNSWW